MPKPPARNNNDGGEAPAAFSGVDVGVNLIACVLIGGAAGYALDKWQGWAPWGMLGGGTVGFCAWLREVWRLIQKA